MIVSAEKSNIMPVDKNTNTEYNTDLKGRTLEMGTFRYLRVESVLRGETLAIWRQEQGKEKGKVADAMKH